MVLKGSTTLSSRKRKFRTWHQNLVELARKNWPWIRAGRPAHGARSAHCQWQAGRTQPAFFVWNREPHHTSSQPWRAQRTTHVCVRLLVVCAGLCTHSRSMISSCTMTTTSQHSRKSFQNLFRHRAKMFSSCNFSNAWCGRQWAAAAADVCTLAWVSHDISIDHA